MEAAGRAITGAVLVLGLGRTGRAVCDLVEAAGGRLFVVDDSGDSARLPPSARFLSVADAIAALPEIGLIVPSPGVPASHPLLLAAAAADVDIRSEPDLAAELLSARLIGVTGTNGKSTCVTLTAGILSASGRRVFLGGNLGTPLVEAVGPAGAAGKSFDVVVAELSSFQLEQSPTIHPRHSALLNLAPDHLDRHGDMAAYERAKARLFAQQGSGDSVLLPAPSGDWGRRLGVPASAQLRGFGVLADGDAIPGAGTWAIPGLRLLRGGDSDAGSSAAGSRGVGGDGTRGDGTRVDGGRAAGDWGAGTRDAGVGRAGFEAALPSGWPVVGHDYLNAAAAADLARSAGASVRDIEAGLCAFRPLENRLSLVAEVGGIEYWNDSKATNIAATLSSVSGMSRSVVLLLGGVSKGEDYSLLARVAERVRLAVCFGRAGEEIAAALSAAGVSGADRRSGAGDVAGESGGISVTRASGLADALRAATRAARPGDAVLLAPACASFDEFSNYAERGQFFKHWVERLASGA